MRRRTTRAHDLRQLLFIQAERLLAKNVLPRGQRRQHLVCMQMMARRNHHRVDVLTIENIAFISACKLET